MLFIYRMTNSINDFIDQIVEKLKEFDTTILDKTNDNVIYAYSLMILYGITTFIILILIIGFIINKIFYGGEDSGIFGGIIFTISRISLITFIIFILISVVTAIKNTGKIVKTILENEKAINKDDPKNENEMGNAIKILITIILKCAVYFLRIVAYSIPLGLLLSIVHNFYQHIYRDIIYYIIYFVKLSILIMFTLAIFVFTFFNTNDNRKKKSYYIIIFTIIIFFHIKGVILIKYIPDILFYGILRENCDDSDNILVCNSANNTNTNTNINTFMENLFVLNDRTSKSENKFYYFICYILLFFYVIFVFFITFFTINVGHINKNPEALDVDKASSIIINNVFTISMSQLGVPISSVEPISAVVAPPVVDATPTGVVTPGRWVLQGGGGEGVRKKARGNVGELGFSYTGCKKKLKKNKKT